MFGNDVFPEDEALAWMQDGLSAVHEGIKWDDEVDFLVLSCGDDLDTVDSDWYGE